MHGNLAEGFEGFNLISYFDLLLYIALFIPRLSSLSELPEGGERQQQQYILLKNFDRENMNGWMMNS